jgi:hypothetical protein
MFYGEENALSPKTRNLHRELMKPNPVVLTRPNRLDRVRLEPRQPNYNFSQITDKARLQLEQTTANAAMQGQVAPRQSAEAKRMELQQGIGKYHMTVENYNNFVLNTTQLLCDMIPYFWNDEKVIEVRGEFDEKTRLMIYNQKDIDVTGQSWHIVANDVRDEKWKVIPVEGDDSKSNRQQQMHELMAWFQSVGNQFLQLDVEIMADILSIMPNHLMVRLGTVLKQKAQRAREIQVQQQREQQQHESRENARKIQAELAKNKQAKTSVRLSPEDAENYPIGTEILMESLGKQGMVEGQPQSSEMEQIGAAMGAGNKEEILRTLENMGRKAQGTGAEAQQQQTQEMTDETA